MTFGRYRDSLALSDPVVPGVSKRHLYLDVPECLVVSKDVPEEAASKDVPHVRACPRCGCIRQVPGVPGVSKDVPEEAACPSSTWSVQDDGRVRFHEGVPVT
jgi:hypothetical protein